MLKFGDIFRHKECVYIFMAAKGDGATYYVAQIVNDKDLIQIFLKKKDDIFKMDQLKSESKINQLKNVTCFIILTTEQFKDCMAHLASSDRAITELSHFEELGRLNEEDIRELKKEIINSQDVLPQLLVKYVVELSDILAD